MSKEKDLLTQADEVVEEVVKKVVKKVDEKEEGDITHVIKNEMSQIFSSHYGIAREYGQYKLDETRSVPVKEDINSNVLYVYQILTQADLRNMIVYGAFDDGAISEEEKIEYLTSSKRALRQFIAYQEDIKEDEHHKQDMVEVFKRVKNDLKEEGII